MWGEERRREGKGDGDLILPCLDVLLMERGKDLSGFV